MCHNSSSSIVTTMITTPITTIIITINFIVIVVGVVVVVVINIIISSIKTKRSKVEKKNEDHGVFTGVRERNEGRKKKEMVTSDTSATFEIHALPKTEEIFLLTEIATRAVQSMQRFQRTDACFACASSFSIEKSLFKRRITLPPSTKLTINNKT